MIFMRYVVNTLENGSFNLSKEAILFIAQRKGYGVVEIGDIYFFDKNDISYQIMTELPTDENRYVLVNKIDRTDTDLILAIDTLRHQMVEGLNCKLFVYQIDDNSKYYINECFGREILVETNLPSSI